MSGAALRRRVLLATLANYGGKLFLIGSWFFLTPFILRHLGPSVYGLWVLVNSVTAYGALLDLGLAGAITKYVAEYHARGELGAARGLVATALALFTGFAAVAVGLGFALAPAFTRLFQVGPAEQHLVVPLVQLSAIWLGVFILGAAVLAVLRGLQRFDLLNVVTVVNAILAVVLQALPLALDLGVLWMVVGGTVAMASSFLLGVWFIHRTAPDLRFGWRGASRRLVRPVFSFGTALFATQVAQQVQAETGQLVIGAFLPVRLVTPFSVSRRLSSAAQLISQQFLTVLLPLAAELQARNDQATLRAVYLAGTRLTLAMLLPLGGIIAVLAGPLLGAWVGPEYAAAAPLVVVLSLAAIAETSQWPAVSVLQAIGRHRPVAAIATVSAAVTLGLSMALVGPLGVMGVALGLLIPAVGLGLGLMLPFALRAVGVSARQALREAYWPALLPALPAWLAVYAAREWLRPESFVALGVLGAAGCAVYAACYLLFSASADERRLAQRLLAQGARRGLAVLGRTRKAETL